MSNWETELAVRLSYASLSLVVGSAIALILLKLLRCRSPRVHRVTWVLVLLQGILLFEIPVGVPFSPTAEIAAAARRNLAASAAPVEWNPSPPAVTTRIPTPPENDRQTADWNWAALLLMCWLLGLIVNLMRWAWRYTVFVRGQSSQVCDIEAWQAEWQQVLKSCRVQRKIPLHVSHDVGPLLYRSPGEYRIVVPYSLWRTLPGIQRQAVLQHELAHFENCDILKTAMVHLLAVIHWFNPIAWFAARRFEDSTEWECDDWVERRLPDVTLEYAKALVTLAEFRPRRTALSSPIRGGSLTARVKRLLHRNTQPERRVKYICVLGCLSFMSLAHVIRVDVVAQESKSSPTNLTKETNETTPAGETPGTQPLGLANAIENTPVQGQSDADFRITDDPELISWQGDRVDEPNQLSEIHPTDLALYGHNITDETLQRISEFTELQSLGIFRTQVTGSGLKHLAKLDNLRTLIFSGPQVTDKWLQNLPAIKRLKRVTLTNSQITDVGLQNLRRFPTIRFLSLRSTSIGDSGLAVLEHLPVLTTLDLTNTQISDRGLANLKYTPHVYHLSLASPNIKGPGLSHLRGLNDLGTLSLAGPNVTGEWMSEIEPLRDIYFFILSQTRVTDAGLAAIEKWEHLERLHIADETITDESVAHLQQLTACQTIVFDTRITTDGIRRLQEQLPSAKIRSR